ncbi:MAG: beta-lactamase family protein [Kiritimatiellaeota bacterium]|nr:beta-lactamase family protein [Kiritimatiellota bacterium]
MRKSVVFIAAVVAANALAQNATVPVITLADETRVTSALLIGSFPHPFTSAGPIEGKPERGGFDTDWLKDFGGEASPKFDGAESIPFTDFDGVAGNAKIVAADKSVLQNFRSVLTPQEYAIAYVIVDIEANEATETVCWFGSDDYPKVWVNGEFVHEVWKSTNGRSVTPGEDKFPVAFKKGVNRVVMKIEQKWGGWGIDVEFLSPAAVEARRQQRIQRDKINRFRNDALLILDEESMETRNRILPFIEGKLPGITFQNPELAEELAFMSTFKVRWFDKDLNEITDPAAQVKEPGLYCAYIEVEAKDGMVLRRVSPAYFIKDFEWWRPGGLFDKNKTDFSWHDGLYPNFPEAAWNAHDMLIRDTLNAAWGNDLMYYAAPCLTAELALDTAPADAWRVSPYENLHNLMTRLRRKIYERPPARELAPPVADENATALRVGTEAEAGFKTGATDAIRAAAQKWCDDSGNGFVLVVARRGTVIMNEAFNGEQDAKRVDPDQMKDGKLTTASRLPTASVTKLHAGVILGRCIDQGFVSLDDPVSKFFPDFALNLGPHKPDNTPTVRQLMNHTSGLDGHRWYMMFEGMVNPFLENVAWWDMQNAAPGKRSMYNGFGIDLGGKVVEDITGRPVFEVMRDGLFAPLGQDNPTICDLGYGLTCTAMDLARVAEMLRQEGAYDGKRYFSRETFKSLLPIPLGSTNPDMESDATYEYGVGISWMWDGPHDAPILGKNVFGHGSATGAILRVAPELELIVTMARYTPGNGYDAGIEGLMRAIAENLE